MRSSNVSRDDSFSRHLRVRVYRTAPTRSFAEHDDRCEDCYSATGVADGRALRVRPSRSRAVGRKADRANVDEPAEGRQRVSITGNLSTMPFADLVQWVASSHKTGTLVVDGAKYTKKIYFRRGYLIAVASDNPREMLGYYLVGWGYLLEEDLRYIVEMQDYFQVMLGELMVKLGRLSREELDFVLRLKSEETIYDLILWDEGNFRFLDNELPQRDFQEVQLHIQHFLFEGFRQRDERQRMAEIVPDALHVPALVNQPDESRLNPIEQSILTAVDGERSFEQLALLCRVPEFDVLSFAYQAVQDGYMAIYPPQEGTVEATPGTSLAPWQETVFEVEDRLVRGRLLDALHLVATMRDKYRDFTEAMEVAGSLEEKIESVVDGSPLSATVILEPAARLDELVNLKCAPSEGFVLSRINGFYAVEEVLAQLPGSPLHNRVILHNLLRRGLIKVRESTAVSRFHSKEDPFDTSVLDDLD